MILFVWLVVPVLMGGAVLLAVLAGFALSASQRALLMVHSSTWPLVVCWAAAAMALVVLVHRSGWLKIAPQDETAQISVTTVRSVG